MLLALYLLAALVATVSAVSATQPDSSSFDTIVVGAGYSGLVTARRLVAAGKKVAVFEAMAGPGGRAQDYHFTGKHQGHVVEHGVAFIGDAKEMPYAHSLIVDELKFDTFNFPVWGPGNCSDVKDQTGCKTALLCKDGAGHITPTKTLFPGIVTSKCVGSALAVAEIVAVTAELLSMTKGFDCNAPWDHPKAIEWDGQTFGSWLRAHLPTHEAYQYMKITVEPDISQDVDSISLLHAVFLAATGGGVFEGLFGFNNGFRIVGGGGAPAARMAAELNGNSNSGTANDASNTIVYYNSLVSRIVQPALLVAQQVPTSKTTPPPPVQVFVNDTLRFTAAHVVVTGSPSVVGKINFEPPLPPLKQQLATSMPMGNAIRMMAVYDEGPFWREMGFSGSHGDEDPNSLLGIGYDMTPCDQYGDAKNISGVRCETAPGVLQVETTGRATDILMALPPAERLKNFSSYMSELYGQKAKTPSQLLAFDFREVPTLGGGSQAHMPPGLWTQAGRALREPFGQVLFAGAEYAAIGFGYVNGAISSAEEAAKAIINATAAAAAQ